MQDTESYMASKDTGTVEVGGNPVQSASNGTRNTRVSSTSSNLVDMTRNSKDKLTQETKLLRDTLDLLWNRTLEQTKINNDIRQENEHLQDYINNLMSSSHVLEK